MDLNDTFWISSVNHLDNYTEIIKSSFFLERMFKSYNLPEGFPKARNRPLIYFSRGEITIKKDELVYNSFSNFNSKVYKNLKEDLSFVLTRSSIKSIEEYSFKEFNKYGLFWRFNTQNWIRIKCNENILGGDFLICIDSVKNTHKLFIMLKQFLASQEGTEYLDPNSAIYVYIGYWGILSVYMSLFFYLGSIYVAIWKFSFITLCGLSMLSAILSLFVFIIWAQGRNEKVQMHLNIIIFGLVCAMMIFSLLKPFI